MTNFRHALSRKHAAGIGEHTRPRVFRPVPRRSERGRDSVTKRGLVRARQCGRRGRRPPHARARTLPISSELLRLSFGLAFGGYSAALASEPAAATDLFATRPVWRIQIELTPKSLDSLRAESRKFVPANVHVLGEIFHDVGVHLKGSTGSFRGIGDKPSFTVDFAKFTRGQKFLGLQKIHLNNSVEDSSYLKEQMGSELFRAAQVPVPRVGHALVELNGRPLGLYVLKEGFTEDFLGRHFQRADGELYDTVEATEATPSTEPPSGRDSANNQTDLQRLAAAAAVPDLNRRWEALQRTLDTDRFLNFMAMEDMIGHWDGYCLGRNNFRIYHDPHADKNVFLPSGMDQLFAKADMPWKPDMAGPVARAILEIPEGRQRYAARFKALFRSLYVSELLTQRVNELLAEMRPFLRAEMYGELRREAGELCARIKEREASLRKQLREPDSAIPDFHHDVAVLDGWKPVSETTGGRMQELSTPDGKSALKILAGPKTSASWRTTVRLPPGRYRFRGNARVSGVMALPFGVNQGSRLRVAGKAPQSAKLTGTSDWKMLEVDVEVGSPEEEVVLVCELRASAGEAWFDKGSLLLVRLP